MYSKSCLGRRSLGRNTIFRLLATASRCFWSRPLISPSLSFSARLILDRCRLISRENADCDISNLEKTCRHGVERSMLFVTNLAANDAVIATYAALVASSSAEQHHCSITTVGAAHEVVHGGANVLASCCVKCNVMLYHMELRLKRCRKRGKIIRSIPHGSANNLRTRVSHYEPSRKNTAMRSPSCRA